MRLILQIEAAEIKQVSRQAISKLSKKKWGFWVGDEINISHPDWQLYLSGGKPGKKKAAKKSKSKTEYTPGNKSKYYNQPRTLAQQKTYIQILKLKLEIKDRLNQLISRNIIEKKIYKLDESFQITFANFSDRVTLLILEKARIIDAKIQKEIHAIIDTEIQKGLQAIRRVAFEILS